MDFCINQKGLLIPILLKAAVWCNENNAYIEELAPVTKGRDGEKTKSAKR